MVLPMPDIIPPPVRAGCYTGYYTGLTGAYVYLGGGDDERPLPPLNPPPPLLPILIFYEFI